MRHYSFLIFFSAIFFVNSCNAENAKHTFKYKNNAQLTFVETPFSATKNRLTDCGEGYICLIDNKPFWGSDSRKPKTLLSKAYVMIKGKAVELDTSGMYNPLISTSNKSNYHVVHYFDDAWKVRGKFSDGSGAYFAEWLINKSGSIRILLGDSELLFDAFENMKGKK